MKLRELFLSALLLWSGVARANGETISPNMSLVIPAVGTTAGPLWASDIVSTFNILDSHDHSAGKGVQITPAGMNISSDLSFNGNNITSPRSVRFQAQGSPLSGTSDLGVIFESGVDLYYRDGNGNTVRITQSGSLSGTPGSISGLSSPASASYVAGNATFVWQSAASTPANLDGGSLIIRNITANSKGITINPPNALASNYSVTFPGALPAQQNVMTLDQSGNISSVTWDNVGQNMTSVGANAVANSRTRATGSSVAAGGIAISSSSSAFSTSSTTYVDVTNLSVTIVTTGRPVVLVLNGDSNTSGAETFVSSSVGTASALFKFVRDGSTTVSNPQVFTMPATSGNPGIPSSSITTLDTGVTAGSHTYKLQTEVNAGTSTVSIFSSILVAYEL